MRLSEYLEPDLVMLDLRTSGVEDTVRAFTDRLRAGAHVADAEALAEALLAREAGHSTSLGNGVALPHTTAPGVSRPLILVGIARRGIAFAPPPDEPVRLFFVLISPLDSARNHIKILARIVRLVRHPGFVDSVAHADSAAALLDVVERIDALHV